MISHPPTLSLGGKVIVSVDVTNSGSRAGDAVPQLYAHHLSPKVERPPLKLAGFLRIHLAPGQTKSLAMTLNADQLSY